MKVYVLCYDCIKKGILMDKLILSNNELFLIDEISQDKDLRLVSLDRQKSFCMKINNNNKKQVQLMDKLVFHNGNFHLVPANRLTYVIPAKDFIPCEYL